MEPLLTCAMALLTQAAMEENTAAVMWEKQSGGLFSVSVPRGG